MISTENIEKPMFFLYFVCFLLKTIVFYRFLFFVYSSLKVYTLGKEIYQELHRGLLLILRLNARNQ